MEAKNAICCFDERSKYLQFYDPQMKKWKQMQKMHRDVVDQGFTAVVLGEYLYVLMWKKRVYRIRYADEEATWQQMAETKKHHGWCPLAAVVDGHIYVVGTYGGTDPTPVTAVEKYDPSQNNWSHVTDMDKRKQDHAVAVLNGAIYCIGGRTWSHETHASVEKFDTVKRKWSNVAPLIRRRYNASATALNGKVYVTGGTYHVSTGESYDPQTNVWTKIAKMKHGRFRFKMVATNGKVFAVGGDEFGHPQTFEEYDPETDKWEVIETIELTGGLKLHRHAVAVLGLQTES